MVNFDYIVVGAGSAGAVVAARLSEDPNRKVLLVEAGPRRKPMNVRVPAAFATQFKEKHDWAVHTEAEPHLDGRVLYHPRARLVGGCSAMNAMIYIRGNAEDYDGWAKGGAAGWSYDEVLPLFKQSERNSRGASAFHGADGPLHIEDPRNPNPMDEALLDGMVATGLNRNADFNGATQEGVGYYQVTHRRGERWTTADGYVTPALKRPNFTLLSGAHVLGVRLRDGRAIGVEVEKGGRRALFRAEREVVLSAGAFNTPQLLMLAGIGPADHLAEHGIDVVVDNPNVGGHLMDHPLYVANYETTLTGTLAEAQSPVQLAKYLAGRRGLLTSNVGEVGGFFHTRPGQSAPDMQLISGPAYFWDNGFATHDKPAYALGLSLVGSQSRGTVRLRSSDPRAQVRATFNYFAEQADMDAMVNGIEMVRAIADTARLAAVTSKELHPGPAVRSRADIEAEIRRNVIHTYHPSCTARIGTESDGVVDPELRVHGVAGLRVADTSVFPTIPHGNTHAPAVMVGEKAAAMISAED